MTTAISLTIAHELGAREEQITAAISLLDEGATVPFIARYRKEITGGLDDAQLRTLEERLTYLRELEERRVAILNSVREQGKLDATLEAAIMAAEIAVSVAAPSAGDRPSASFQVKSSRSSDLGGRAAR